MFACFFTGFFFVIVSKKISMLPYPCIIQHGILTNNEKVNYTFFEPRKPNEINHKIVASYCINTLKGENVFISSVRLLPNSTKIYFDPVSKNLIAFHENGCLVKTTEPLTGKTLYLIWEKHIVSSRLDEQIKKSIDVDSKEINVYPSEVIPLKYVSLCYGVKSHQIARGGIYNQKKENYPNIGVKNKFDKNNKNSMTLQYFLFMTLYFQKSDMGNPKVTAAKINVEDIINRIEGLSK